MNTEKNKHIFAIIGGDRRQEIIGRRLVDLGHEVRVFGLGELLGCKNYASIERMLEGSEVIILPLPATRDNVNIFFASNLVPEKIKLTDIIGLAVKNGCKAILGGMLPLEMMRIGKEKGVFINDFYDNEDLQVKNALPSAEGALMIAMEHTEKTVSGMKALITGHGRIGSLLVCMLEKLGAKVTVAVRNEEVKRRLETCGYEVIKLDEKNRMLKEKINDFDVIFNTVPYVLFTDSILSDASNKPLYIEIASSPGGIDVVAARRAEIQTIFAPSLPGKYAPISAGEYIFETICEILAERSIYL